MATVVQTLVFRGPRRVRLFFTGDLAAGAFTSTTPYTITSLDGAGPNPINVTAVFAVTGVTSAVELAADADFAGGGLYEIGMTAVPVSAGPAFTGVIDATVGLPLAAPINAEPATNDLDLLLYSRDILYDGNDFVLAGDGDLATVNGRDNFIGAMKRRVVSAGLQWDPTYGANSPSYVNAPEPYRASLAGALLAQARADDRTKTASVDIAQSPTDVSEWDFLLTISGRDLRDPFTVNVPIPIQTS